MRYTKFGGGIISLMALAIAISMIVAAGAITWPSPLGKKTIVVTDSELFSEPVMTFNQSVSEFDPSLGVSKYQDAHLQATEFETGNHYWFDFSSIPTADARNRLAQSEFEFGGGWVWIIEVLKDDIQADDVNASYRQDTKRMDMRTHILWNDSQPGRLVGFANLSPDRWVVGPPLYYYADFFNFTRAHGVIQFNETGEYIILAYLVEAHSVTYDYSHPPKLDGILACSPEARVEVS